MVATVNAKQETKQNGKNTQKQKLNQKHYKHCCGGDITQNQRGLEPEWVLANCYSADIQTSSDLLYYQAKSPGIMIVGKNGQYQFKPDKPWADKQGKKAPKYRTAKADEYDALLPNHPEDPNFWLDIEKLKEYCYIIDSKPFILITEGAFKAISAMMHGYPTVALAGVEMGLTPSSADPQGKRYLVPSLELLAKAGFGFILAFDADTYHNGAVKLALIKLAHQLQKFKVPIYCLPEWDERLGKGIDDFIQMNGIEEFRKKLIAQAISWDSWQSKYAIEKTEKGKKIPKADILALELAAEYQQRWLYCDEFKSWLIYEAKLPGVWKLVSSKYIEHKIANILEVRDIKGYGSHSYIRNILARMELKLLVETWKEEDSPSLLPFKNGVLEIATGKFYDHNPDFRLTWQLPRNYDQKARDWSHISDWLDEAIEGRFRDKHLLLCFAAAVLRGRYDLQKFLHLIGHGGTGKSTFTNLLIELVGEENVANFNIVDLEDKHEIARIFTKRLIVMPDQDKVGKRLGNFKRLTGGDRLAGRKLFENSFEFIFEGMAVVTSNFPIFHSNLGSWLIRRQSMVAFERKCPNHEKRDLMPEFIPELSAFTNYLLSIPIKDIENTLNGVGKISDLSSIAWDSLMRSDGLAAWVNDHVIYDPDSRSPIGSNSREWIDRNEYIPHSSTLYGSYSLYCRETNRSAKSLQNFSSELIELCKRIIGWDIEKSKVKITGKCVRVIKGLRLRNPNDDNPTIEDILEGDNPIKTMINDHADIAKQHLLLTSDQNLEVESLSKNSEQVKSPVERISGQWSMVNGQCFQGDNPKDNQRTNQGDNPKSPPDKESSQGDNLILNSAKNSNNFFPHCDSSKIVIDTKEVEKNLSRNLSQVVPSNETPINTEVQAVPQTVSRVDIEVVAPCPPPVEDNSIEMTEDESWPAEDIGAVAELLSSCRDVKEFETDFYPESIEESPFPRNILNQAAQMLPVAKYEEIKGWVIEIKNKNSTPPATTEAVKENPIDPTPETKVVKVEQQKEPSIAPKSVSKEPDWSTFPHLTSKDNFIFIY